MAVNSSRIMKIDKILDGYKNVNSNSLRKIKLPNLIYTLCEMTVNSSPSYRDIALEYSNMFDEDISKVAFYNLFNNNLENILKETINMILIGKKNEAELIGSMFGRILIQDSTTMKLLDSAPDIFQGLVKKKGCKIQTYYDINSNSFDKLEITPFNVNDQKYSSEIKSIIRKFDLIIRDLGYFNTKMFRKIAEAEAFFLSKVPTTVKFFNKDGTDLDLLELLESKGDIDKILLMSNNKVQVRVIAQKLPDEIANARRRKKKNERKANPSKKSLALLGWNILVTNIFETNISAETLFNLYKLRWKIEIIFKTWKSFCSLTVFHKSISKQQIMIYTFCRLLSILLMDKLIAKPVFDSARRNNNASISYQSFLSYLYRYFKHITSSETYKGLYNLLKKIMKYSLYEKRKRCNMLELEHMIFNQLNSTKIMNRETISLK